MVPHRDHCECGEREGLQRNYWIRRCALPVFVLFRFWSHLYILPMWPQLDPGSYLSHVGAVCSGTLLDAVLRSGTLLNDDNSRLTWTTTTTANRPTTLADRLTTLAEAFTALTNRFTTHADRATTLADRFPTPAQFRNRYKTLRGRITTLADRSETLAVRSTALADRFATLADRFPADSQHSR